jgi:hypothetical protein
VRAQLLPPNLNSSLILQGNATRGDEVTAGVQMPAWTRRRVCPALTEAGFRADERVSWFLDMRDGFEVGASTASLSPPSCGGACPGAGDAGE